MFRVDFKKTTWERIVFFDEEQAREASNLVMEGKIRTGAELCSRFDSATLIPLEETDVYLKPTEEHGSIEVYRGRDIIWDNKVKQQFSMGVEVFGDDTPMPFGQHKGKAVGDLDAEYLLFLYKHRSDFLSDTKFPRNQLLKAYIEENFELLKQESSKPYERI